MLTRHYRQWVFAASENPYDNFWFGSYNESRGVFTPDPIQSPTDHGLTLALGVVPKSGAVGGASGGGRRINWGFISTWMAVKNVRKLSCGSPTMPCVKPAPTHGQSVMSLPLEMALKRTADGRPTVAMWFVPELRVLRVNSSRRVWRDLPPSAVPKGALPTHAELQPLPAPGCCGSRHFELAATLSVAPSQRSGLHLLTSPLLPAGRGPLQDFSRAGPPYSVVNDTVHSFVSWHRWHLGCILQRVPATSMSLRTGGLRGAV